ncbi:uncharacterized protein LOC124310178 [Neodiprion virginianus]|uniref:uncharacterized protein LOC124310178 n=1 Tax=Neodiprion virginianus TaxID=2961670 RepID=UPI001EE69B10|nr:uncharacterized protein LOC124310178 [Neodiprion virginianus]
MPIYCDVKLCYNNKYIKNQSINNVGRVTLFALPKKEQLRKKWHEFIRAKNPNRRDFRVCNKHFEPKYIWKKYPRCLLTRDAVPTLNGPVDGNHRQEQLHTESKDLQISAQTSCVAIADQPHVSGIPSDDVIPSKDGPSTTLYKENKNPDIRGTPVIRSTDVYTRDTFYVTVIYDTVLCTDIDFY